MPAPSSLADLANDPKYAVEPKAKSSKGVPKPGWTLNSRYVLIHMLFNVLGEKAPRNTPKGKLPSIDATALEKMETPFANRLASWRSVVKAVQSLQLALRFAKPTTGFTGLDSPTGVKAVVRYATVSYDNVERCFTMPKESIPLNLDKAGRKAFIVPAETVPRAEVEVRAANAELLAHLAAGQKVEDQQPLFEEVL